MNIVHLIDYFQPALGYQETFLAREQLRLGHTVHVVTADRFAPFPDYARTVQPVLGERLRATGRGVEAEIAVWRLPVRYEGQYRCWLKGLDLALAELRPDVVHAHNVVKFTTLQAALLKPRVGYRLLVDDHMHWVNVSQAWGGRLFYRAFRQCVAPLLRRRVDALVAITAETAEISRAVFGLTHPAIQVIELGVDTELFQPDAGARRQTRAEMGLDEQDFLLIYTGKLIEAKSPHWLVEALAQTPPHVKALLLGNAAAAYSQRLEALIVKHQVAGRVFLQPAVKQVELPRFYAAADAGCWPRETSLAMLEAAACGLPIIVVNQGVEARVRNQNGLTYPEGNVAALAAAIMRLASDDAAAQAMGRRGRQLVEAHYSWVEINRQFMALY